MARFRVEPEGAGARVDHFIATAVPGLSVAAARRLLETGSEPPKQVAARCGFSDPDTLRRAFARHVGVTPAEYRKRFAASVLEAAS